MTRYLVVTAIGLGACALVYRWVFRYRPHVDYPEFRARWAKLPDTKKGRPA